MDMLIVALLGVFDAKIVYFLLHRIGAIESRDPEIVGDIRKDSVRIIRYLDWASGKTNPRNHLAAPWKQEVAAHMADLLRSELPWTGQGEMLLRIVNGRCQG